jgi:hypothetical protein
MLTGFIECNDDIRNRDLLSIQEKVAKTSIITYIKSEFTARQIQNEMRRIEQSCKCHVEHLPKVGAFILTFKNEIHISVNNLQLDPTKEAGAEDEIVTLFEGDASLQKTPNDPRFRSQWSLGNLANNADINAQSGWTEYLSDSTGGNRNGPKVVVAVIDSGVDYNHPDLRNMMWVNPRETPGNGIDDDNNGIIDDVYGADFTNGNTGDPMDRNGHGTHCAGVIAAERDNSVGIAGVASVAEGKVKIMAVKGLGDDGTGSTSGLLKSLNYAIGQGAKISSNSWGSRSSMSNEKKRLFDNVLRNNQDHLFVAAAGNYNDEISNNHKPMVCGLKWPNLLCVANSKKNDRKSGNSNYGKDFVHVFAPGTEIYSTYPNNGYRTLSGTSMACPHVSGLAALIMTMRSNLKARDVKDLIEAKVQRKTVYKSFVSSGGLIDVENTLKSLNSKDKFAVVSSGTCHSKGLVVIRSEKECEDAANYLDINYLRLIGIGKTKIDKRPNGCIIQDKLYRANTKAVDFNTNTNDVFQNDVICGDVDKETKNQGPNGSTWHCICKAG